MTKCGKHLKIQVICMLKNNEPNVLSIHGLREVKHCPPHFSPVIFNLQSTEKKITDWLYENLDGRFYSGQIDVLQDSGKTVRHHCVAFELPGEASYFALKIDTINVGMI